jgi:phosphoglycerol transferase MdoB-like AlkP superfamily enzyme
MKNLLRWNKFVLELGNLIFFWLFGVTYFFIFRIIFIVFFYKELGNLVDFNEFFNTFIMGFRFDCTAVAYFLFIPLLILLILSPFNQFKWIKRVRLLFQYLFVILSVVISVITINYYMEYKEQFNNYIFLGLYDDKKAVGKTIIEYYHPVLNTFIILSAIVLGIIIFRFFEKKNTLYKNLIKVKSKYAKAGLIVLILLLFTSGIRGSFTKVPAIRKWAAVSQDPFLNKTVINPYRSFKYAYEDFKELNLLDGKNPFGQEDLRKIYQKDNVSQIIEISAQGNTIHKPKQIFLVIMESYDSWSLMEKYQPFGFSENLSKIAENGTHFTNFLPSYNATFFAYGTIVSGIPYCGVNISLIGTLNDPYISSIFTQFKKLGYKTNLFYGGFLSWENIGEFTKYQGCEKIYSGIDAGGKSDSGDWGVEDEKLFDLVLKNINPDEYTFNLILTSSYHPPYAIDIYKKGFPYKFPVDFPAEVREYYDKGMTMQELGHLWYGDYAIGRFMKTAEKKYGEGLFCFTGDHYGRRFINHSPNLYERSSVPFILYGKGIPKGKNKTPGSHVDIMPTLLELIAPKGFKYYSFGSSLFSADKNYGIGFEKAIDKDSLFYFPKDALVDEISLIDYKEKKVKNNKYQDDYNKLMRLAWYYTMKGNSLSETK